MYRDGYVVFEGAYYSVPFRLVGQTVWIAAAPGRSSCSRPTTSWWRPMIGRASRATA